MSTPKQVLNDLAVAYRRITGLDGAHDPELRAAEDMLARTANDPVLGDLALEHVATLEVESRMMRARNERLEDELLVAQEDRRIAIQAYRELLLKYDRLEERVQK